MNSCRAQCCDHRSTESQAISKLTGASTITFRKFRRTIYQCDREPSLFWFLLRFRHSFIARRGNNRWPATIFCVYILEMRILCVANFLPFIFDAIRRHEINVLCSKRGPMTFSRAFWCVRSWFCSHSVNRPHFFFCVYFFIRYVWHEFPKP